MLPDSYPPLTFLPLYSCSALSFPLEPNKPLYLNSRFELLFLPILPEYVITGVASVVDRGFNASRKEEEADR